MHHDDHQHGKMRSSSRLACLSFPAFPASLFCVSIICPFPMGLNALFLSYHIARRTSSGEKAFLQVLQNHLIMAFYDFKAVGYDAADCLILQPAGPFYGRSGHVFPNRLPCNPQHIMGGPAQTSYRIQGFPFWPMAPPAQTGDPWPSPTRPAGRWPARSIGKSDPSAAEALRPYSR